jgi:hypothetical protein
MKRRTDKPRPICLVCGKPIGIKGCGFPKRESSAPKPLEIKVENLEHELEAKLRERGVIK